MINELHQLAVALSEAGVAADSWYREYKPIPKITEKAPCIRIVLSDGRVERLESVQTKLGPDIRKYGNNQGTFPAMNLAALYRITDEDIHKKISDLIKNKGRDLNIGEVKKWCTENNWGKKFSRKYQISMKKTPMDMLELMGEFSYSPLNRLIELAETFPTSEMLHRELERKAFEFLERKKDIVLALQILFYLGKKNKNAEDDYGNLSVILDSVDLESGGLQSAGNRFTRELNQVLLQATQKPQGHTDSLDTCETDAFGMPFLSIEQPMPQVNLAGGFSVSLRTMFKGQPCQYRYQRIENATYPISLNKRQQLADALTWLSMEKRKDKTWINTDRNELLFVYPSKLTQVSQNFICIFKRREIAEHQQARFETEAAEFREHISKTKRVDPEHYPDHIQVFVLRKLDNARSKVIYTRHATPDEIIQHSEEWQDASNNLPQLTVGQPRTLFPLEIAEIMNCVWRQDGVVSVDAYKPVASYHGVELLFGMPLENIKTDLHRIIGFSSALALYEGRRFRDLKVANQDKSSDSKVNMVFWKFRNTVMLMAMLLYWLNFRRSDYVKEYPYLLGQMLKASDALHALYCQVVRKGDIPPQLIGCSMYVFAAESPLKAFRQLMTRMKPYMSWAKSYRIRGEKESEDIVKTKRLAGYYLSVIEKSADGLLPVLTTQSHFNDTERAFLFIGYLASFPKEETVKNNPTVNNGGNNDER